MINLPQETEILVNEATAILSQAKTYVIQNNDQLQTAASELASIKTKAKQLDEQRKRMTKPLDDSKKEIMDFFRAPLDFLADAEGIIKHSIAGYQQAQERAAREAQAKLDAEARKQQEKLMVRAEKAAESGKEEKAHELAMQAASVVAPVVAANVDKAQGISTRQNWKAEVTDKMALVQAVAAGKLPISMLDVNMTSLNAIAKATKGEVEYPGVRFYPETVVSARGL
jgi:hypothetical protein